MLKVQVVILDITGNAKEWIDINGDEEHMDLCEIITIDENSPIPVWDLPKYDNWDYLLVFEQGIRSETDALLNKIGISSDRVIYPLDLEGSVYENRYMSAYIFGDHMRELLRYLSYRKEGIPYSVVTADGLSYMNASTDNVIIPMMLHSRKNWARDEMEFFYKLANEYYEFNNVQNIFCDIGANIGTTCIYFKKRIDEHIKIMAFEPSMENYKLLRINAILNDIDPEDHLFIRKGLSDKNSIGELKYDPVNPGGSSFMENKVGANDEVELISLDDYLNRNKITASQIKYFWVDVEGFEARFLAGAMKTISQSNAPLFMEFIPKFYMEKPGEFEMLMRELERHFKHFICYQKPDAGEILLEELWKEKDNTETNWDLFLLRD